MPNKPPQPVSDETEKELSEYEKFSQLGKYLFQVPKTEIDAEEEKFKAEAEKRKHKPKQKQ
jgi:hypothetical protein